MNEKGKEVPMKNFEGDYRVPYTEGRYPNKNSEITVKPLWNNSTDTTHKVRGMGSTCGEKESKRFPCFPLHESQNKL